MTKHIRVENADTGSEKVVVQLWEKSPDSSPDTIVEEHFLNDPAAMTDNRLFITSTRYLVVKEPEQAPA